ncbi:MAG TPA: glycosyltransferase family 39 protein [Anaerolineae bacterium]|nr:glycosyltransferase family 39 protein [Anaerolineae bacterium]HQH37866.1 glycosyltransferase family 39 protein [Anaerolineae bacterium]
MKTKPRWRWGLLIILLLLTFALRVGDLDGVPPGLTHDEAANGHDSAAILRGVHRLYFPVGYGREPLYNYSVAAVTFFLGQGIFTLRITSVFWSLFTWTATVALARRWWGGRAALLTGAALTSSFWPLMMARVGLRATTLPALLAASALAYEHALTAQTTRRMWSGYALAGIFLGASLYTYMASRGMPALYLTFLVALIVFDRRTLRRSWPGTLAVVVIAALVSFPLFYYLHIHPELEQRIAQLGGAIVALKSGEWRPLWKNIGDSLPLLFWQADPSWLYNIAGRAALEPLLAAMFVVGTLRAVTHLRDRRCLFVLLWLAGGLAPAFLTSVDYNTLHAIAALPAVFLLVGLGLETAWEYSGKLKVPGFMFYALRWMLLLALLFTGVEAVHAYFVTWGQNRDVRVLYRHHVVALGRYLEDSPVRTPVVITSLYPGEFHDPYTMEVTLRREDLDIRWSDGRGALFFPHGETRLYTETQAAPGAWLRPWVDDDLSAETTLTLRDDDIPTAVYGYRWDADAAWRALHATLTDLVYTAPGDPPPGTPHNATLCPVVYGGTVALMGYRITPQALHPGETLNLLTAWEVRAAHPAELVLFTHLLNADNVTITQVDRLDAPSWQWQAGDRFAHLHALNLPPDLPPGSYALVVGFYTRAALQRLPIDDAGPITRVLIPVEVVP